MYIWIHDKYSYTSFNKYDKIIFLIMCVSVVQWSRSCLHTCKPGSTPAKLFSVSLYVFFFSVWPFLNTTFLLAFFFVILTAHLASHPLGSISGVLFWKRDFKSWKSSWSAYWPSLRPEKKQLDRTAHTSSCWPTCMGQTIIIEAPSNWDLCVHDGSLV